MRGQVTVISRIRVAMASSALISRLAATASPDGEAFRGDAGIAPYKESRCLTQTAGIFYFLYSFFRC